jgi:hypothetical protein
VIIGLVGKSGSGKDTAAGMIPGAKQMSFADPLKEFCAHVFDWDRETLWGPSELRNKPDPRYGNLTPRHALQTLGTNWGRELYQNVWVDLGIRRAQKFLSERPTRPSASMRQLCVVFADCRFVNEARAIREAGGQVWRIVRPGAGLSGVAGAHPSEMEQESLAMDQLVTTVIVNSGSFEDLRAQVSRASAGTI